MDSPGRTHWTAAAMSWRNFYFRLYPDIIHGV
jgi:hypothetical protein